MSKPNCYECKHRVNILGDCHSECKHPNAFLHMVAAMAGGSKYSKVRANPHGVTNGWFCWPFNFDPVWLEDCELFEENSDKKKQDETK